ncbi:FliA/WhiG family RNA polymerase sigma factor [Terrilactibacillus sp. BCM23-1]|uniref:RNA polymerase sigma factor n=1 Tax=Terrilactibacillus tamarindi TaxID=2599694 RepID=A0A6N8CQ48_9BACI|nr:FliA/WhiG family RNA polymerase sigma factor [Terrilactibacillus tamarindi]MTT32254.1 FliA/WhiG family RNA polymerase sigma factor [Terrilactibacillus tamarindi]
MVISIMDQEKQYWKRWIDHRDPEAADNLLKIYLPLVHYHVQRIILGLPNSVSRDELVSHGLFGLYDALEKFDTTRDLKFDTYASFRIRGSIIDGLRKEDWMPRSLREKNKKIEATTEMLEQKYLRSVTLEEVARACDMSTDDVAKVVSEDMFANLISLDEEYENDKGEYPVVYVEDKSVPTPDHVILKNEKYKMLSEDIKRLNEKEQLVITLFYYEELTLTEIGHILELSTSRISQIHSKAIYKLRHYLTP